MKLFWVAGEESGDRHAARLITALREAAPEWTHAGMGGAAMREAGCETVADISQASLMGLTEVVLHLPRLLRLRRALADEIEARGIDLVIPVDFPDFNLALLALLRRRAARGGRRPKILYYISPQVWAWRRGRARTIARRVDAMAVLFPFEGEFYRKYGLETVFFGHPLAGEVAPSADREALREEFGLGGGEEAVTLLPGSRRQEVKRHLPLQLAAVERFRADHPGVRVLIVRAETVDRAWMESVADGRPWVRIVDGRAYDALAVARAALVKSGTSTVEAALIGTPFTVLYSVSGLTYFLAKLLVRGVRHVAMVNVIAGREIVPERIQGEATPGRLAADLRDLWEGPRREEVIEGLREVTRSLGEAGASRRLAEWIVRRFGGER